jgi:hypothetical protein
MKFIGLGYFDQKKWDAMSDDERDAIVEKCFTYDDELFKSGNWLDGGQPLQSVNTAKTLRWKSGKVVVTDGPFAETKEQLGGLAVLEARDMEHAVELMSRHPGVRLGPFEIRPFDEAMTDRCTEVTAAAPYPDVHGTKVVCLGCSNEAVWNGLSKKEQDALIDECMAYDKVLRKYGRYVDGAALQPATTAKTLRSRDGKVVVTDGPYAETKEQIGGVAILEFVDIEQAVEAWSKHPCLRMGDALELRPVDEAFVARWESRQQRNEQLAGR